MQNERQKLEGRVALVTGAGRGMHQRATGPPCLDRGFNVSD